MSYDCRAGFWESHAPQDDSPAVIIWSIYIILSKSLSKSRDELMFREIWAHVSRNFDPASCGTCNSHTAITANFHTASHTGLAYSKSHGKLKFWEILQALAAKNDPLSYIVNYYVVDDIKHICDCTFKYIWKCSTIYLNKIYLSI